VNTNKPTPTHARSIIVVGVDESESSRRALAWAAGEALRRGSTLEVVTTWSWDAVEGAPLAAVDPEAMSEIAETTQKDAIAAVLAPMDPRPAYARIVVQASPAAALVQASRTADLLVVGTHGRGPVRSFLLGSVSQAVIKHSACPVVVMPPVHESEELHEDLVATHTAGV
jgi:nucleotide-binding universal stress UspA family protein